MGATNGLVTVPDLAKASTAKYNASASWSIFWYQPKETKDKKYTDKLARWSAKQSMTYYAKANATGTKIAEKCTATAVVLKGASSLVAGAAIAFGAASLF